MIREKNRKKNEPLPTIGDGRNCPGAEQRQRPVNRLQNSKILSTGNRSATGGIPEIQENDSVRITDRTDLTATETHWRIRLQ